MSNPETTVQQNKPKGNSKPKKQEKKQKNKKEEEDEENNPKEEHKFTVKTPKVSFDILLHLTLLKQGTKDYGPLEMAMRKEVFSKIETCFKRHGAVTIETPLFELKEILTGKYGEDSKLIFDLQDQGGELCSLRYDLTVPFARYMAMNKIKQIKRYQIGRVYRRDQPMMNRGRYREFYQCDFDIAGDFDPMVPDAEAISLMCEIIRESDVGTFVVKLNHRKLLDGIFEICGVPTEKFRSICSAVDKLDKTPWAEVRTEMIGLKGLDPSVADKIEKFVMLHGQPRELLNRIRSEKLCDSSESAQKALSELELLFSFLEAYDVLKYVSLDLSLARGLDYYTGVIYECVLTDSKNVGSIAAGGRYDELIGLFSGVKVPSVGFSVGIERVYTILEKKLQKTTRPTETQVFVASIDPDLLVERMKICAELWKAGIKAELLPRTNPKIKAQLSLAESEKIPFAIIFGTTELSKGIVQLKHLSSRKQKEISRNSLVEEVKKALLEPEK